MASAWRTTSRQRHHRRHLGTPPPPLDHTLVVPGLEIGLRHGAWESRPGVGDQGETYPNPLVPDQAGHGQTVSDEEIGLVDGVKERRLLGRELRIGAGDRRRQRRGRMMLSGRSGSARRAADGKRQIPTPRRRFFAAVIVMLETNRRRMPPSQVMPPRKMDHGAYLMIRPDA